MTKIFPHRIHFIGICGVAMSALAIAFKKRGWQVTGSDAGFFPPISTELEKHGVEFYPGWHAGKLVEPGVPDIVVVGNVASSSNPEWLYVQKQTIPYLSYPELIAKYIIKEHSIVCAGTYGKTTTSALLSWILMKAGFDPSYMFGGLAIGAMPDFNSAQISDSAWSVLEGDEYKSARWDNRPKFSHYSTTHLLLTGVVWDHADVYPTEQSYIDAFRRLISQIPASGIIVACSDDSLVKNLSLACRQAGTLAPKHFVTYGQKEADFTFKNVLQNQAGISFDIAHQDKQFHIESPLLGDFQAANITGAFALAADIGIHPEKIRVAITEFTGLKRRLEKRYEKDVTIFDDIAHSPAKARATLATLRQIYSGKIFAVFEPNTGNRKPEAIAGYDDAFRAADEVVIPRLTKVKKNHQDIHGLLDGEELAQIISRTHKQTIYLDNDSELVAYLKKVCRKDDVVVFLGSHGFRGMIEALITQLQLN